VHDVPVGAAPRALWVRTLGTVSWLLVWAFHEEEEGKHDAPDKSDIRLDSWVDGRTPAPVARDLEWLRMHMISTEMQKG
jgi:hypothetical protein